MADDNETTGPGAVRPAKVHKAGCGIRYDEDELSEGIDFSGAARWLMPTTPAATNQSESHDQENLADSEGKVIRTRKP